MVKYIKDANILADGTVFKHLRIVPETMVLTEIGYLRIYNWRDLVKRLLTFTRVKLPDENFVLIYKSYKGYYHWLLESLPRLLELKEKLDTLTLLLPDWATESFYYESAALLGIKSIKVLSQATLYRVNRLILPYFSEPMGSFSQLTLLKVKDSLQSAIKYVAAETAVGRKLYVSRSKAARRKVINEEEVVQCVIKFGFEVVYLEDYIYSEQLRLCSEATTFLGIHGAGLSNIFLMPAGATVIELRKFDDGVNWFFERLAHTCGHQYYLQYCNAIDETLSVQDADLLVNVSKLEHLLSSLTVDQPTNR